MGKIQFVVGPSGAGKSTKVYSELLARAGENPDRNYLVIVPDQYTMQTQKQLASMSEIGGILNIDVLSFGRLTHRILEEVGTADLPVLDDTGKCLVLQKVAASLSDQMPVLGKRLHRQGYIQEAKSAISEFMQYGISVERVGAMAESDNCQGALRGKLKDLQTLYRGFTDYLAGKYITTEEKLDILRSSLGKSALLPDSCMVFDGFTGFTPIQLFVIADLLPIAQSVTVTLALGSESDIAELTGEQDLFYLSKKTYLDLCRLAKTYPGVEIQEPELVTGAFRAAQLNALEEKLFRYDSEAYEESSDAIWIDKMSTPSAEVHQVGRKILQLIREEGLEYRQIAMVVGDLSTYAPYVEREFASMGIPCYIDQTRGIRLNPMVEAIRSALQILSDNYSQPAMFHYLRSGVSPLSPEETDALEKYVKATGVRGKSAWNRLFVRKTKEMEEQEEPLALLNSYRERVTAPLSILCAEKKTTARAYVEALYDFLVATKVQERLLGYADYFDKEQDLVHKKEYEQIYGLIMELLDQVVTLLGEEEITLQEFAEILDAGFGEIRVGTIPQNVDRISVGDMERTRLQSVKILFFLGVNDGNVPSASGTGGLLSDMDREFLAEEGMELAPTPRQQMYSQRLYLYLNMTKPMERLYVSYAVSDMQGKPLRPSYLIEVLKGLFPKMNIGIPEQEDVLRQVVTREEGYRYLAAGLRDYVDYEMPENLQQQLGTLLAAYEDDALLQEFLEAAFYRYDAQKLPEEAMQLLYGAKGLFCSVSQLETYAKCAHQYFLRYGLSLKEENPFEVRRVDQGIVYHNVLKAFSDSLKNEGHTWETFPMEYAAEKIHLLLQAETATYGAAVYYDTARNENRIRQMEEVLLRTVSNLQKHVAAGEFALSGTEIPFWKEYIGAEEGQSLTLNGKIDRVETVRRQDGALLVSILDYKSSEQNLDYSKLYYGQQLQLPLYMGQELQFLKEHNGGKEVYPAAMLYCHMTDPVLENIPHGTPEEMQKWQEEQIDKELKLRGLVSSDAETMGLLDGNLKGMPAHAASHIHGLELNKDGELGKRAPALGPEDFSLVIDHAQLVAQKRGKEILGGEAAVRPQEDGCKYCPYRGACAFEPTLPGFEEQVLPKLSKEDALEKMRTDGIHERATAGH